jgi:anti-anti-sigma regulatory factor
MTEPEQPVFTVDASGDPVVLRVNGRASYLTSGPVSHLFGHLLDRRKNRFLVDFTHCTGMDSTFLGILAGAAMRIRREAPEGRLELCNLNDRNRELVRNLGLQKILSVHPPESCESTVDGKDPARFESVDTGNVTSRSMLEAHRSLVDADAENASRFQDVIKYLEQESE